MSWCSIRKFAMFFPTPYPSTPLSDRWRKSPAGQTVYQFDLAVPGDLE